MKTYMLGMMLGAMMASGSGSHSWDEPIEDVETRKKRLALADIKRRKANGHKEFFYGENSLYALNQKNADKQARKKNWL